METLNTIKGHHVYLLNGTYKIEKKEYFWHIPKILRDLNIQKGDFVRVSSKGKAKRVIVCDVFRENVEDTGKRYKPVLAKIAPPPDFNLDDQQ